MPEVSAQSPPADLAALARLGDGGRQDRIRLRLIVKLLVRCLGLLRPLRWHAIGLLTGFSLVALSLFPVSVLLVDVFWTRALQGEPLLLIEARVLGYDPATTVDVAALDPATRSALVRTVVYWGAGITAYALPLFLGLYYYQIWLLQKVNQALRIRLIDQFQSLSLRFHSDNPVGDAIYRLYQDSAMVTQLIDVLFISPITNGSKLLFAVAIAALFDPKLACVFLLSWPFVLLAGAFFSKRLRIGFRRAREANSRLTSRIQQTLAGIKVIKAYGAESREQERFEVSSREAFREAFSARRRFAVFQVVVFWCLGSAAIAAIALATLETRDATPVFAAAAGFTAWNLGLYNVFKDRASDFTGAGRDLLRTWARLQDISIGLDRVFEVLDLEPDVQDAEDAVALEGVREEIAFEDVGFAYQPDRPVLEDVTLSAGIGTITAIVGPTGSGKSTLMALLLRLFDPTSGRIRIDGRDLRAFTTASLREQVSIALQENVLFGDTIRENIRFAVPEADASAVRGAAEVACAHEFIESLPEGYDTPLGERGTKLSTGQRQRLSIARAVLKDTPILVLDEPTAALDAATELRVMESLASWGRRRAIFVITHRLSTIRQADQIVYLRDGRIEEAGSHEELMARPGGLYRKLVETERASGAAA